MNVQRGMRPVTTIVQTLKGRFSVPVMKDISSWMTSSLAWVGLIIVLKVLLTFMHYYYENNGSLTDEAD